METKRKKQKIEGREITEGNTGEPFGGNTATKPSRITVSPKGSNKENPFGLKESMVKPKTKRKQVR
jgi:hypothetical protein